MPCAACELFAVQELTLLALHGHLCRGGCGGRLHGTCGHMEQEGESELRDIWLDR